MQAVAALTNIHGLAKRFGLPAGWFKAEAVAGRLPHLKIGRRFLFNPEAVERVLTERAATEGITQRVAGNA